MIGLDMARDSGEVAVIPGPARWRSASTPGAWIERVSPCRGQRPDLMVCEATGGYEVPALVALAAAGLPVGVVHPRHVRDFAKATGVRAKTDRLDAEVIARFGSAGRPPVRPLAQTETRELQAYLARHRQWIEMRVAEQNRLPHAQGAVRAEIQAHITWLQQRLPDTDPQLNERWRASPVWRAQDDRLQSIPGVGPLTRAHCLAQLPELAHLNRREIAALAALAPFRRDRGTWAGHRTIGGGRRSVRNAWYLATVSAIRCNPPIKPCYPPLIASGKPPQVAWVAGMRKLLTIMNAMLKTQTPWQPQRA